MGRAIKYQTDVAIKHRARVRKYRTLKKIRLEHEIHIQNQIQSIEIEKENVCDDINEKSTDGEEESEDDDSKLSQDVDKSIEFMIKLRFWAVQHRITHSAINDLLSILIFGGFFFLPRDSRTLMETPKKIEIIAVSNEKFWYNGVQTCLEMILSRISCDISITLDFSFDGLPIFNSSNTHFWPILSSIQGIFFQLSLSKALFNLLIICFKRIFENYAIRLWYLVWRIKTSDDRVFEPSYF